MTSHVKLENGQCAVVFDDDGGYSLYIPKLDDDAEATQGVAALMACVAMLDDPQLAQIAHRRAADMIRKASAGKLH